MEELWAENTILKNALQTLETALKTTIDALKAVRITITKDRADFQKKLNDLELSFEYKISLYSQKKLNDLELSFENKISLYSVAENDFTIKSCKAVQKNIDKLNVELSRQISQIREKPIQKCHEESDNSNPTLQTNNSFRQSTQRFPPVEAEVSLTEPPLSTHEHSDEIRYTQPDTS